MYFIPFILYLKCPSIVSFSFLSSRRLQLLLLHHRPVETFAEFSDKIKGSDSTKVNRVVRAMSFERTRVRKELSSIAQRL